MEGDDKTYVVSEIYPPFIANFMKSVGGMTSFGKMKTDVIKYWMFWGISMAFCNFWEYCCLCQ